MKQKFFPRSNVGKLLCAALLFIFLTLGLIQDNEPIKSIPYVPSTPHFQDSCLSSEDGSNYSLIQGVKRCMDEPNSFVHVKTKYVLEGKSAIVVMDFRGKNHLGGSVPSQVTATIDTSNCKLIKMIQWD